MTGTCPYNKNCFFAGKSEGKIFCGADPYPERRRFVLEDGFVCPMRCLINGKIPDWKQYQLKVKELKND